MPCRHWTIFAIKPQGKNWELGLTPTPLTPTPPREKLGTRSDPNSLGIGRGAVVPCRHWTIFAIKPQGKNWELGLTPTPLPTPLPPTPPREKLGTRSDPNSPLTF